MLVKIGSFRLVGLYLAALLCVAENYDLPVEMFVKRQNRRDIAASVDVVGRTPSV